MTNGKIFRLNIKGPDTAWEYTIPEGQVIIGRQVGTEILLEHPQISRKHAQIDSTPQECSITDLNSSNGTFVNENKITPGVVVPLTSGDIIKIGPFSLEFETTLLEIPKIQEQPATKEIPSPIMPEGISVGEEPHPLKTTDKPELPVEKQTEDKEPQQPPPKPPPPPPEDFKEDQPEEMFTPPGLFTHSTRFLNYLPDIYHTEFMSRFLAIFESIFLPIEWNIDNFDLFLSPGTTPREFIPWFSNLFRLTFDPTWTEEKRRQLLSEAHIIFARRGTQWALSRVLEIYTGVVPEINDKDEKLDPHTFRVKLPLTKKAVNSELIEVLIDHHKPAHTMYDLQYKTR